MQAYSGYILPLVSLAFLFCTQLQLSKAGMIDKKGMKPWEICGLCHNLNGISHMAKFPKLAGQKASYIKKQLLDFKKGLRTNDGGQMEAIVTEVAEENIPLIAEYFSSLKAPEPAGTDPSQAEISKARELFLNGDGKRGIPACSSCHVKLQTIYKSAPFITTQHASYLEKQLKDFKDKARENDKSEVMQNIAAKLSEEEIRDLAQFIARQKR